MVTAKTQYNLKDAKVYFCSTVFSDTNFTARIDAHVANLGEARVRNFSRWPNYCVDQTYEEELQSMKDWI